MYTYWYTADELGRTFTRCASIGAALDTALMDMSAGQAKPERIELDGFLVLDRNDIDDIYARTWKQGRSTRSQLVSLLTEAHPHVCSLLCPSVWKTGEEQQHVELCKAIRAEVDA